jgi:hypothetical protein
MQGMSGQAEELAGPCSVSTASLRCWTCCAPGVQHATAKSRTTSTLLIGISPLPAFQHASNCQVPHPVSPVTRVNCSYGATRKG